jgi:hypothetical protein
MNKKYKDAFIGLGGSLLFIMGALYIFSWLWYMPQEHARLALAQPPPPPVVQTRSCADYTPAKLIALLDQLLQESAFWPSLYVTTGTVASTSPSGTMLSSSNFMDTSSYPDSLRARARELLARADAEERRERLLAEVQWVVKECGGKP